MFFVKHQFMIRMDIITVTILKVIIHNNPVLKYDKNAYLIEKNNSQHILKYRYDDDNLIN